MRPAASYAFFFLVLLSFGDADPKTARQRATGPHTQGAKVQYDNAFPHFVWSSLSPLALEASARKLRTASRQPAKFNWRTRVPLRKGQPLIALRTKLLKAACLVFGCLCFFLSVSTFRTQLLNSGSLVFGSLYFFPVCSNFPDTAFEGNAFGLCFPSVFFLSFSTLRTQLLKAACLVFGPPCFFFVCFNSPDAASEGSLFGLWFSLFFFVCFNSPDAASEGSSFGFWLPLFFSLPVRNLRTERLKVAGLVVDSRLYSQASFWRAGRRKTSVD